MLYNLLFLFFSVVVAIIIIEDVINYIIVMFKQYILIEATFIYFNSIG